MNLLLDFPLLSLFIAALVVFVIVKLATLNSGRQCPQCRATLPRAANFCSRCGQKLDA
jgi:predicted amidophosphoribosyltransferase